MCLYTDSHTPANDHNRNKERWREVERGGGDEEERGEEMKGVKRGGERRGAR